MGRLGRKFKAGTGRNTRVRSGNGGISKHYLNGPGHQPVPPDSIPVPDEDIGTHPSSTDAIQIPIAPAAVVSCEKKGYLSSLTDCVFRKNASSFSGTLEMQLNDYCVFQTSMAEHGQTSKSQLPNVLAKIHEDKIIVTIELSNASYDELRELQGDSMTVSAILGIFI
jgi:hypothetical protein